jgi:drug/metabolite transporter (DMT)-like permease
VNLKNIIDFVLLSALWGMSYVFIRLTVGHVAPIVMAESRLVIAALGIAIFAIFKKSWRENLIPYKKDLPRITIIASLNSVIPFALFTYAMQYLNAGMGAILNSTSPIWTAIIGAIWLKDRLSPSRIVGLILGFSGIVFMMWGKAHFSTGGLGLPILASIGVTFSYGIATNYIKVYGQGIQPFGLAFSSMVIGSLMLAIPAFMNLPTEAIPLSAWIGILGLGIGSTSIAYILFYRLIDETGPTVAITVTFLVPVFSILWGDIFLDEQLTLQTFFGGLIIILGTALAVGLIPFKGKKMLALKDEAQ